MEKNLAMLILNCLLLFSPPGLGQTRTKELEEQRSEHEKQLAPEKNTATEQFLLRLKDVKIIERINYGYNGSDASMMISATACAGTVELSVCSDTASIPDNRLTISAPPSPPSNALGPAPQTRHACAR